MDRSGRRRGDLVTVGLIATAHGIRGEVAVHPLTDDPGALRRRRDVLLEAPGGAASPRRILGVPRCTRSAT